MKSMDSLVQKEITVESETQMDLSLMASEDDHTMEHKGICYQLGKSQVAILQQRKTKKNEEKFSKNVPYTIKSGD